jgi:predicted dehydrogenase
VRAILCEKPFTSTAAEAERLVAAARAGGVLLAEAFKFRHHPAHLELKARVDLGVIGDLVALRSTFCQSGDPAGRRPERNWRWDRARGGGSIYDLACYGIHHARYVFGAEPLRVFASAQIEGTVDIAAALQLVFPGARTAHLSVGHNLWRAHYAEVCGTQGMLRLDNPWNNEDRPVALVQHTAAGVATTEFAPVFQFAEQLQHLVECLTTGRPHRIPPENSIAQMRVIDAAFESVRTGQAVDLFAAGPVLNGEAARRPAPAAATSR